MQQKKLFKLLLLIAWMLIIFLFSSQPNSGAATHDVIKNLLPIIKNDQIINILNFIIRKSAHLIEYFVLALLVIWFLKEYNLSNKKLIIITLIFCYIYAVTDEYHQTLIIGRTGQFKDTLIDITGSILAIISFKITSIIKKLNFSKNKI